jgi:hypothetical protein
MAPRVVRPRRCASYRPVLVRADVDAAGEVARRCWIALPSAIRERKSILLGYLASSASGRVDATTRPLAEAVGDDHGELIDTEEAAEMLGLTTGAMRRACRDGRYDI